MSNDNIISSKDNDTSQSSISPIDNLINEYRQNRDELKKMILDLESLKLNIDKLFPQTLDYKYMRFFEEKIKTVTSLFNSLLDIRKEINRSIKEEIDLRRKIEKEDTDDFNDDVSKVIDIRQMAKRIENLREKVEVVENKG